MLLSMSLLMLSVTSSKSVVKQINKKLSRESNVCTQITIYNGYNLNTLPVVPNELKLMRQPCNTHHSITTQINY